MKILIPPSEGKSKENATNIAFGKTEFLYKNEIKKVLEKLSECENSALTNIYGSSHEKSVIQHKENLELFKKCRLLADLLQLPDCSMGMSGDWKEAVEAGSTWLRLGSLIFGDRY